MLSPHNKSARLNMDRITSSFDRQDMRLKSGCSTLSPQSARGRNQSYCIFKRKLLEALLTMDPLGLLQSGIFEEYESTFLPEPTNNKKFGQPMPKVSNFETYLQSYPNKISTYVMIQEGIRVTQVQRRSRSCERISREQRVIRNVQEQRNAQFVIFSNLIKQIPARSLAFQSGNQKNFQSSQSKNENILDDELLKSSSDPKLQTNMLVQELQDEKQTLQKELRQCMNRLQHQKALNISANNQKTSRELEFLLKEKQLSKKIQQYKDENENLRLLLQNSQNHEIESTKCIQTPRIVKEVNRMESLKQKVANEGRVKWALSRAWGAELTDQCK